MTGSKAFWRDAFKASMLRTK